MTPESAVGFARTTCVTGHLGAGLGVEPGEDEAGEAEIAADDEEGRPEIAGRELGPAAGHRLTASSTKAPSATPMLSESCCATLVRLVAWLMSRLETSA